MLLDRIKNIFKKNEKRINIKDREIQKPDNPISFDEANKLCSPCIVRPVCNNPCESIIEIYRSHVIIDKRFNYQEHRRKYSKEYQEMYTRMNKSLYRKDY